MAWELIDFHHRVRGLKAVWKVFLDDLDCELRGQFFGILPGCFSEGRISCRVDHAIGVDFDDDGSITYRRAVSFSAGSAIVLQDDFKKKSACHIRGVFSLLFSSSTRLTRAYLD